MISNVIHKWLNNMWSLVQFELVTYVHVYHSCKCTCVNGQLMHEICHVNLSNLNISNLNNLGNA
jgi:hypothetical protein